MDFLDKYQERYLPNIHSFRYQERRKKVQQLKQICAQNPDQLAFQDLRTILRVLKYYKLLPQDNIENDKLQQKFSQQVAQNFCYAFAIGFSPFFLKQFYAWRGARKFLTICGLFVSSYGLLMYPIIRQLDKFNRKLAQENIHKYSSDIEQKTKKIDQVK